MNKKTKRNLQMTITLVLLLFLLVPLAQALAQAQPAATIALSGTYAGSVMVDAPAPLGALDLVLNMTDQGGSLSGQVNEARTQVFLGGPLFTGTFTNSQTITSTFRIDSQPFTGQVSGRTVQRRFTLDGEVSKSADALSGNYTETITGFTPKPLLVKGRFLLVRPAGSQEIIPVTTPTATVTGTPTTPTPTRTPTATPTGTGDSLSHPVYLPIIAKNGGN